MVVEDCKEVYKMICLQENMETLGREIERLSSENTELHRLLERTAHTTTLPHSQPQPLVQHQPHAHPQAQATQNQSTTSLAQTTRSTSTSCTTKATTPSPAAASGLPAHR